MTKLTKALLLLAIGGLFTAIAGCNILGPASYLINGRERVPAQYTLDKELVTVVFIDDPLTLMPTRDARIALTRACEEEILEQGLVKDMIKGQSLIPLLRGEKRSELASVTSLGKQVKAQIVIHALVKGFSLSSDGQQYSPIAMMEVKVIDVATGKRLFPKDDGRAEAYDLSVTTTLGQGSPPITRAQTAQAELELAKRAGSRLAKVFYESEQDTVSSHRDEIGRP